MAELLKVGVVGCGGIANAKHLPAIKVNGMCQVVATCDIIRERAEKAAKEYGTADCQVFEDYHEMLKLDLDCVFVCTPNRSHSDISVAALDAGCHVMCEKPMAINYAEACRMLDAAKRNNKLLTIGYQSRYRVNSQYLKQMCEDGELGDIYLGRANAIRRRAVPTWGVFLNEYEQGGGPLIDIGTHALDLTLWMMNTYKPLY
ncbi:MAG: Gfo/Idh/MocA family oxidoreductase, partial [Clostridia bacterium]|nr:Gfo/Idh/MocA family oxidoreductase [Clostridia bacterium]